MAVVRGGPRDCRDHHPTAKDTVLVAEVADANLRFDRERKGPVCAPSGIPEYWIPNLEHRTLEAYRRPEGREYLRGRRREPCGPGPVQQTAPFVDPLS